MNVKTFLVIGDIKILSFKVLSILCISPCRIGRYSLFISNWTSYRHIAIYRFREKVSTRAIFCWQSSLCIWSIFLKLHDRTVSLTFKINKKLTILIYPINKVIKTLMIPLSLIWGSRMLWFWKLISYRLIYFLKWNLIYVDFMYASEEACRLIHILAASILRFYDNLYIDVL